jgi:hypothetical protein
VSEANKGPARPISFLLTRRRALALTTYYTILILTGICGGVHALTTTNAPTISRSLYGSILLGGAGAGTYYVRRLYRAGISGRLNLSGNSSHPGDSALFGTTLYLAIRPLIAMLFSLIVTVAFLAAIETAIGSTKTLQEGFLYNSLLAAFVVGFSSGLLMRRFERRGIKSVEPTLEGLL